MVCSGINWWNLIDSRDHHAICSVNVFVVESEKEIKKVICILSVDVEINTFNTFSKQIAGVVVLSVFLFCTWIINAFQVGYRKAVPKRKVTYKNTKYAKKNRNLITRQSAKASLPRFKPSLTQSETGVIPVHFKTPVILTNNKRREKFGTWQTRIAGCTRFTVCFVFLIRLVLAEWFSATRTRRNTQCR